MGKAQCEKIKSFLATKREERKTLLFKALWCQDRALFERLADCSVGREGMKARERSDPFLSFPVVKDFQFPDF